MERSTTRAAFCQALQTLTEPLAEAVWTRLVAGDLSDADTWLRATGSAWLRQVLGAAVTARAEQLGVAARCACGGAVTFRQRRPARIHTVLAGRDIEATVQYGQCAACQRGHPYAASEPCRAINRCYRTTLDML